MARKMRRKPALAFLWIAILVPFAWSAFARAQTSQQSGVLNIEGLGRGYVVLDRPWQFHIGDDIRWAQPDIDDAHRPRRMGNDQA